MDWNLRTCARKGHVTYAPDEPEFRAQARGRHAARRRVALPALRRLRARRAARHRPGRGRAGAAARQGAARAFILRALAIERWVRGLILLLLGVAVLRLKSTQVSLQDLFDRDLRPLKPFFTQIHFNVSDSATITSIEKVLHAKPSTLT